MMKKENNTQTTVNDVVAWLDDTFRPELQEDYDNAGFLLGRGAAAYTGALVALDLTSAVVDEAVQEGLNLIVTHHPFIFTGLRRVTDRTESGRLAMELIEKGISVYAAHTNLDNLPWGVNGALAKKLEMKDCRILRQSSVDKINVDKLIGSCPDNLSDNVSTYQHINVSTGNTGAGMVGDLAEPVDAEAFLLKVKQLLGIPFIRTSLLSTFHSPLSTIRRVAICGGSGSFLIGDALAAHADIFLTADLKYHDFQRTEGRMILADVGHYESEQFAKDVIFDAISKKFTTFACRISKSQEGIVRYI